MSGCKLETIFTVDSTNNLYKILSNSDVNAVIGSITAGDYFVGSHHTDYGSLCAEIYRSLNAYGATCSTPITCSLVSVSSTTRKMTITMSGGWWFQYSTTAESSENSLLRYIGFIPSQLAPLDRSSSPVMTSDAPVGYIWFADDGVTSLEDSTQEVNAESRRSKIIRTESISGRTLTHDLLSGGLVSRRLKLSFVPSDRMFGPKYGQGYSSLDLNFGFESGGSGDASYWTRGSSVTSGTGWWTTPGTKSGRISGSWPSFASATAQTGSYHFELGDKAGTVITSASSISGDYVEFYQYLDLSHYSGVEFDLAFDDTTSKCFTVSVLRGTTTLFSFASSSANYTLDRANIPINFDGQTGLQKIAFRLTQSSSGSKTLPKCAIDNIRMRPRSNQSFEINSGLEALWINAKSGRRIRYYPDASKPAQFREYNLSSSSAERFTPEPINGVLDRWSITLELDEYVA